MRDIVLDRSSEKDGLLGHETDLTTKPLDVKLLEIGAVQFDDA